MNLVTHIKMVLTDYRAKLKLPESLHPKSLVDEHVHVSTDGIFTILYCFLNASGCFYSENCLLRLL